MEWNRDEFRISCDPAAVDRAAVHAFLTASYWAQGIPRETVDRSIDNSLCFALLDGARQIGFARVVSDGHTVSYLADVFVLEHARGRGVGVELVRFAVDEEPIASTKFILHTRDMHPLYAKLGFAPPDERLMERWPRR
jgi:GNAT superfamily N-acetyltransferase